MPTYTLRNKQTGSVEDIRMSIADKEALVEAGEFEQIHQGTPTIVSQAGSTLSKTSGDWKNLMEKIKKGSGRDSTMAT